MPCQRDEGWVFDPCEDVMCPCPGCEGRLEFTGPNLVNPLGALVFLECRECRCAYVAPVSPEGLCRLSRERVVETVDEHH